MSFTRPIFLSLVFSLIAAPAFAHQLPEGFKGFEDPASCGVCHKAIYEEWAASMHAKSSKASDPVHAAVHDTFLKAMAIAGKPGSYFCGNCHAPTADNLAKLMKGEASYNPDDPSEARGVTCSFCHKAEGLVEGKLFHMYKIADGIKGPFANASTPHGATYSEFASTYKVCMGCHGKLENAKGAVICSADQEGYSDCLSCHMKEVDGAPAEGSTLTKHHFHGIAGAHNGAMLKEGAKVTLGTELGKLVVSIKNPNPHYFPSTNPMRMAYLKVEVSDASGKVIYSNFKKTPIEDPKALFIKVFKAGDKVGVPTWEADGVAKDTRLKAGEDRTLTYDLPKDAAKAVARLYYRFVPPQALSRFGIQPDGVVEKPHIVSEAEISLKK